MAGVKFIGLSQILNTDNYIFIHGSRFKVQGFKNLFQLATPVKYAPVRFSEPTPVEHPEGTRFNRAGGINFAPHCMPQLNMKTKSI
jgi:hypothetical protein